MTKGLKNGTLQCDDEMLEHLKAIYGHALKKCLKKTFECGRWGTQLQDNNSFL